MVSGDYMVLAISSPSNGRGGVVILPPEKGAETNNLLHEVFGTEMTGAANVCGTCADARPVAELAVYPHAPGTVVRCRTCHSVLMVFATIHDRTC
jgi:Family of unknown function (DUF6510)